MAAVSTNGAAADSSCVELSFTVLEDKWRHGVVLNRETIYLEIWKHTLSRTAAGYGISPQHLKAACVALAVPTPTTAYWGAKDWGREAEQTPLPAHDGPARVRLVFKMKPGGRGVPRPDGMSATKIPFTKIAINQLKPPRGSRKTIVYWDTLTPNFGLRLMDTGSRSWIVGLRPRNGSYACYSLGSPDPPDNISLEAARNNALDALSDVATFLAKRGKVLFCSFCGKSQHAVEKLIAGPTVYICNECVQLCSDICAEETRPNAQEPHRSVPDAEPQAPQSSPHERRLQEAFDKLCGASLPRLNAITDTVFETRAELLARVELLKREAVAEIAAFRAGLALGQVADIDADLAGVCADELIGIAAPFLTPNQPPLRAPLPSPAVPPTLQNGMVERAEGVHGAPLVKVSLTTSYVEALLPPASHYARHYDAEVPGLYVRVQASGLKSFEVHKRTASGVLKKTLGRHPEMTVAQARQAARNMLASSEHGQSPQQKVSPQVAQQALRELGISTTQASAKQVLEDLIN